MRLSPIAKSVRDKYSISFFAIAGDGRMGAFGEGSEPRIELFCHVTIVLSCNVTMVLFYDVTIGTLEIRGWKSFGYPTGRANRERFYHTSFDRPVPVTARNFLAGSDLIGFCTCRLILRLQHLDSSDPNVHRAHKTAQNECGWKHGERVVCSNVLKTLQLAYWKTQPCACIIKNISKGKTNGHDMKKP